MSVFSKILHVTFVAVSLFAAFVAPAVALEEDLARQVLMEINRARTEPLIYAGFLGEFRTQFEENSYQISGTDTVVRTSEGVAAVDEAMGFLAKRKPLPPLGWSAGLAAAAADQVLEQGKSGATGHKNEGKGGIQRRVKRHGIAEKKIGENIAYGSDSSARGMVIDLIIDDGVQNRGHRKNQFDPTFAKAGVSCGSHPRHETMCVIIFSSGSGGSRR